MTAVSHGGPHHGWSSSWCSASRLVCLMIPLRCRGNREQHRRHTCRTGRIHSNLTQVLLSFVRVFVCLCAGILQSIYIYFYLYYLYQFVVLCVRVSVCVYDDTHAHKQPPRNGHLLSSQPVLPWRRREVGFCSKVRRNLPDNPEGQLADLQHAAQFNTHTHLTPRLRVCVCVCLSVCVCVVCVCVSVCQGTCIST